MELPEHMEINNYAINLVKNKQLPYRLIYSLGPVEMETLKMYIDINITSGYIRLSKSLTGILILFVWKSDGSFCLCIDY